MTPSTALPLHVRHAPSGPDVGQARHPPGSRATARAFFVVSAVAAAGIGAWAASAPRSFYRSFPGFGRHWISALGPYNEHLPRQPHSSGTPATDRRVESVGQRSPASGRDEGKDGTLGIEEDPPIDVHDAAAERGSPSQVGGNIGAGKLNDPR